MAEYTILNINENSSSEEEPSDWKLFPLVAEASRYATEKLYSYFDKQVSNPMSLPNISNEIIQNIVSQERTKPSYVSKMSQVRLYHHTKGRCREEAYLFSTYILDFLDAASPCEGEDLGVELFLLGSEQELRYFNMAHYPVMVVDRSTQESYIVSTANAYNKDGTFPEIEGVKFDRVSNVLAARSPDLAIEALHLLEGLPGTEVGQWKKELISYELLDRLFCNILPVDFTNEWN